MNLGKMTLKAWLLFSILSVGSATGITAVLFTHQRNVAKNERSVAALDSFRSRFALLNSVHIVAEANIVIYGEKFAAGRGSLEYWAQADGQYRTKCHTDGNL